MIIHIVEIYFLALDAKIDRIFLLEDNRILCALLNLKHIVTIDPIPGGL